MPRGAETAKLLYNGGGWVTHDEMNIFGHTGLKNSASWGNCKQFRVGFVSPADQNRPHGGGMDDAACLRSLGLHTRFGLVTETRI